MSYFNNVCPINFDYRRVNIEAAYNVCPGQTLLSLIECQYQIQLKLTRISHRYEGLMFNFIN